MLMNFEVNKGNKERWDFFVFIIDEYNLYLKFRLRVGADVE